MEAGGVIKLIGILNVLIQGFGSPSACLAIDELDAGIFEYMLDELLVVFKENAKGQLLFTSHNLSPLKVLDGDSAVFSCAEPHNRYMRMKDLKETDSLYDAYLEAVASGGPVEGGCRPINRVVMAGEFRKAGRRVRNGVPEGGKNSRVD